MLFLPVMTTHQELHFQKGYGFVHFPYTPEGVASALKCCDELHNRTVDKVTYKCNISHRLKQCMNGTTEEEDPYGMDYSGGDYGAYPQLLMVNPMSMPGIPMGYAYNSAGVMVPVAMAVPMGDSYQYMNPFVAMNQYQSQLQSQLQSQMQQGAMQGQQGQSPNVSPTFGPMSSPHMYGFGFPQQYAGQMPNMLGMMPYSQSAAYYNQLSSAAGPYSWQYPYCNSAGEQTLSNGAQSVEQSQQSQQSQESQQNQGQQASQNSHSATNGGSDGTTNTIVTGFAVQKPSAAAIAAAVHGDVGFVYATPGSVGAYAHNVLNGGGDSVYGFHQQQQYSAHGYDHNSQYHQGYSNGNGNGHGGGQNNNGANAKTWAALFANSNHGNGHHGGSNGHTANGNDNGNDNGNSGNGNGQNHNGNGQGHKYPVAQAQMSAAPMVAFLPAAVNAGAQTKLPFTSVGPSAQYGNGVYPRQRTSAGGYPNSGSTTNGYSAMVNNLRNRRDRPIRTIPITTVQRTRSTSAASTARGASATSAATVRASSAQGTQDSAGSTGSADSISGVKSPDSEASDQSYASTQHTTSEDTALDSTPVLPETLQDSDTAATADAMVVADGGAEVPVVGESCGEAMIVVCEAGADGADGSKVVVSVV